VPVTELAGTDTEEPVEAPSFEIITTADGIHTYQKDQIVHVQFPAGKIWLLASVITS
jgi:hypothetical protein